MTASIGSRKRELLSKRPRPLHCCPGSLQPLRQQGVGNCRPLVLIDRLLPAMPCRPPENSLTHQGQSPSLREQPFATCHGGRKNYSTHHPFWMTATGRAVRIQAHLGVNQHAPDTDVSVQSYGGLWMTQTRTTSPLSDQRMPRTSLRVAGSMPLLSSAAIASSITATNSCSLIFIPLCVASMS